MKNIKRISALVLALIMVLALTATAFAADLNSNGVIGDSAFTQDNPTSQGKVINLKKELTVFNPDETYVYGPDFRYTYTLRAGNGGKSITDAASQHSSDVSTVTTTLSGIVNGATVNNGTHGDPWTWAQGTVIWSNSDILEATAAGKTNLKDISIDFTNVVFSQPGVYRYEITETPAADDNTYVQHGITEGSGTRVRYLDVYVMRDPANYVDGDAANEWMIYGYVCFYNDEDITADTATTVPVKTTGFVAGTSDGTNAVTADQYHTYNLTITKDVVGDNSMSNHQFPFEVTFDVTNGSATDIDGTFQLIAENTAPSTVNNTEKVDAHTNTVCSTYDSVNNVGGTSNDLYKVNGAQVLSASSYSGKIGDGDTNEGVTTGSIKLIGIPYGVVATVEETNDNIGTTYTASVKEDVSTVNGASLEAVDMTATTGTMNTATTPDVASIDYNEKASRTSFGVAATSGKNVAIQFTNKLAVISPTGVAFRVAPYVLMLCAGIALVLITRRRENTEEA